MCSDWKQIGKKEFLCTCRVRKQCIVPRETGTVFQEMSIVLRLLSSTLTLMPLGFVCIPERARRFSRRHQVQSL